MPKRKRERNFERDKRAKSGSRDCINKPNALTVSLIVLERRYPQASYLHHPVPDSRLRWPENAFTEDSGGEQTGETKDFQDDYRRRDTYHQSKKKGRYRRREHQDRERTKKSDFERDFQTKDAAFAKEDTFAGGAEPELQRTTIFHLSVHFLRN